jgi:ankyrin repeat protein
MSDVADSFLDGLVVHKKRRSNEDESIGTSSSSSNDSFSDEKRKRLDLVLGFPLKERYTNPLDFIRAVFRSNGYDAKVEVSTSSDLFQEPTEEAIAAYSQEVVKATRERNIDELRRIYQSGKTLNCCNRFGESLMHMACRRGLADVVRFMVEEANCSLFVRDDYGRTAMHDAAWSPQPNFELIDILINYAPELLLFSDVRGHTPFSYVRKEHWQDWIDFFDQRREKLCLLRSGKSLITAA